MNTAAPAKAPQPEPEYLGHIDQPNDPIHPDAPPAQQEPAAVNPRGEDDDDDHAPKHFVGDDKRAAFYNRLRQKARDAGDEEAEAGSDPAAPFAGQEGEESETDDSLDEIVRQAREANGEQPASVPGQQPAPAAQPAAPAAGDAAQEPVYTLKVNRNEFQATRAQLLQMAELTPEEASGVPDSVLVRSAQIAEAARQRLLDAKGAKISEAVDRQPSAPHPGQGSDHNADGDQPSAPQSLSALSDAELVRRIQYGDEEEAALALRESSRRALAEDRQQRQQVHVRQTVETALADFEKTNPDLVSHSDAMELLTATAIGELRASMVRLGADPHGVAKLSQEDAVEVYSKAVAQGAALPPVSDILARAEEKTRRIVNLPKNSAPTPAPSPRPTQQPQPSAIERRLAAKSSLAQTPQRAGAPTPAPSAPTTREGSRLSTYNWMRQTRFQKPLGQ